MKRILISSAAVLTLATQAWAGGAIETNIDGRVLKWNASQTLVYNPENAPLKSTGSYNVQQTLQLLSNAFNLWLNEPNIQLNAMQGQLIDLPQNELLNLFFNGRDACYPEFFPPSNLPCVSPILFDEDGQLTEQIFGQGTRTTILGFAGYDDALSDDNDNDDSVENSTDPARTIVKRGLGVFNGTCIAPKDNACSQTLTDKEVELVIQHEIGHMLGMDHSQVNLQAFAQCVNDQGCTQASADALPLMFPVALPGAQRTGLHNDDKAYFQRLYGDTTTTCSVSGTVLASDAETELRGAEVLAINVNPNLSSLDDISFVSGAEAPRFTKEGRNQGNCRGQCGDYLITGLKDGQTYQLCTQPINGNFTGGSSINPLDPPFGLFSGFCPDGLQVTCDCNGNGCSDFTGQDIITDADPSSIQGPDGGGNGNENGGGCSLIRPKAKGPSVWKLMQKALFN